MPYRVSWFVVLLSTLSLIGSTCQAHCQGFVEHLEPPVLERGKTTRVTVVGTQLGKAIGLWTSLPAGAVKATPVGNWPGAPLAPPARLPGTA